MADGRAGQHGNVPADVVVIGAGPAGVTVALELSRAGRRVLLVPGGGRREKPAARDLHRAESVEGPWGHEPLEENRRRALGGASALWGGRCVPLDPIDFEARDWVPASGWPISYQEYWSWAERACAILRIGRPQFRRQPATDLVLGTPLLSDEHDEVTQDSLERWSPPIRFARLLARDQDLLRHCEVLPDAQAVRLLLDGSGAVAAVQVRQGDRDLLLRAGNYVLAAGGLENPRLLLHSGIGDRLPAVGRYYMTHTVASVMSARMPHGLPESSGFVREDGIYCRHRWQLADSVQRSARVGNAVAFFAGASTTTPIAHHDPLSSGIAVAHLLRKAVQGGAHGVGPLLRDHRTDLRDHLKVLAAGDAAFWAYAARAAALRLGRHPLPMVLPHPAAHVGHVMFQAEHFPHRDSHVALGDTRDALGVRRLRVGIRLSDDDFATVLQLHRSMARHLSARGAVPLSTPEGVVEALRESWRGRLNSHAHHIGTTRMGVSITDSVVDSDCRVHGIPNLYVAGSSVFPTGGHANPTLSIVMLSARLGARLAGLPVPAWMPGERRQASWGSAGRS